MTDHPTHEDHSLSSEIRRRTGINPAKCYQCGKCSAGCPMVEEMGSGPHEMMRKIQLDRRDEALNDESIWLCLTCETCTARCPNECDPARVIDSLRELAMEDPNASGPKRLRAFHKAFLNQVRMFGREFEMGLVMNYKLTGGPIFADITSAPVMFVKGKLALVPKKVKDIKEIRRIFDACLQEEEKP